MHLFVSLYICITWFNGKNKHYNLTWILFEPICFDNTQESSSYFPTQRQLTKILREVESFLRSY